MKTHTLAFALSTILCFSARAELKWDQTTIELHPTPADKQAVGHFKYQNAGKTPVRFKSMPRAAAQLHKHKRMKFRRASQVRSRLLSTLVIALERR
jgi:hypothetical protein